LSHQLYVHQRKLFNFCFSVSQFTLPVLGSYFCVCEFFFEFLCGGVIGFGYGLFEVVDVGLCLKQFFPEELALLIVFLHFLFELGQLGLFFFALSCLGKEGLLCFFEFVLQEHDLFDFAC
jgi:hypothetical protein